MKFAIFLSLSLLTNIALAQINPLLGISCADSEIQDFYDVIKDSYDKTDSSRTITTFRQQIKKCGKNAKDLLYVDDEFLGSMAKESQKRQFLRIKEDIDKGAQYGDISEFEKEFADYSKKIGFNDYESYLAEQKKQASSASAYERKACTPVDIRKDMPPVRNQDSTGWCYAFNAADLASYKLKKNISAADIALENQDNWIDALDRSYNKKSPVDLTGGFTNAALKKSLKTGFCLESDLPSEDNSSGDFAQTLRSIDSQGRAKIASGSLSCGELYETSKTLFPSATLTDLRSVLEISSKANFTNNLREKTCKNRIKADFTVENFYIKNDAGGNTPGSTQERKAANIIDEQISAKNPVSLYIDANAFYDRRAPATNQDNIGAHAVTVVGRRFNEKSGQCEYLLRNSWGTGCSSYDKSYQCENGNFWMKKTDMLRRTGGVTYVK
ncbi:C1 family peptidase [Bdellovibrio sp. HCB209]|uniref:C1 family peptidase n=1 Tax=Bdellovibrio sp. HCB209 TaxID=3394354 RepID=UPI0039B549F8